METRNMEKKRDSVTLSDEIMFEIFSRVPAKSICRFRFISKEWNSIFSDPYFIKSHLNKSPHTTTTILTFSAPYEFQSSGKLFNSRSVYSIVDPFVDIQFHLNLPGWDVTYVSESLNGLICFRINRIIHICNPVTRDFITLPNPLGEYGGYGSFCFGYDSINNHYKVLSACADSSRKVVFSVFVLGADSWRTIDGGVSFMSIPELEFSVCINGAIYFWTTMLDDLEISSRFLVNFDVINEVFRFIKFPNCCSLTDRDFVLMSLDGDLAIVDFLPLIKKNVVNIWLLEVSLKATWDHKSIAISFAPEWGDDIRLALTSFAGANRMGEIIFTSFSFSKPFYLYYFDMTTGSTRRVEILGLPEGLMFGLCWYFTFTAIDHVESLVSLRNFNDHHV